jgi:hypothetical protein
MMIQRLKRMSAALQSGSNHPSAVMEHRMQGELPKLRWLQVHESGGMFQVQAGQMLLRNGHTSVKPFAA